MNRNRWPIALGALLALAILAAIILLPHPSAPTPPHTPSPTPTPPAQGASPTPPYSPSPPPSPPAATGDLPTITPPAPGEPTLPSTARPTQAALTTTPTPVPATGHDDVPMVEVSAGEFIMGESYEGAQTRYLAWRQIDIAYWHELKTNFSNETPRLTINLPTFSIDQFQVTNARYRACVQEGICAPPIHPPELYVPSDYADNPRHDHHPAVGVRWRDAVTYCQWVGKRLPTEAEWEKAARGADGRNYPWGDTWDPTLISQVLEPVGSHPEGASPYGAQDMLGTIQEWTADLYAPYPGNPKDQGHEGFRVIRGALFMTETLAHVSARSDQYPDDPVNGIRPIGFRCASSQTPPPTLAEALVRAEVIETPVPVATVNLSRMVKVPAGEFILGTDDTSFPANTRPARHIYLDTFYIDRYEATYAEYAQFLNALGSNYLACDGYTCAVVKQPGETPNGHLVPNGERYAVDPGFEDYPVTYVSWYGAMAYCRWQGKRLPAEAEWEKAARGSEGQLYPWGNTWDTASKVDDSLHCHPVGNESVNVSPYGVYDMLGNAREWVADWYSEDYYARASGRNPLGPDTGREKVIRSGGGDSMRTAGVLIRRPWMPAHRPGTGFRCAYTVSSP